MVCSMILSTHDGQVKVAKCCGLSGKVNKKLILEYGRVLSASSFVMV